MSRNQAHLDIERQHPVRDAAYFALQCIAFIVLGAAIIIVMSVRS